MTTLHLCPQCAAEKGVQTGANVAKFPLSDFLASMGKGVGAQLTGDDTSEPCDFCGATLADFRDTGRLGCPHCYETFETHLRDLLRRLHGSSHHVGEIYLSSDGAEAMTHERDVGEMRRRLKAAIETEDFELAAELRDQLRALE
ncbi:MAG: UvrB/UvrC motif-containing protein [Gemmatimonadota bacterium]|nr:MAG: UvrB/UvrC motif-containing protein [Gemmatimonadota bacterium]